MASPELPLWAWNLIIAVQGHEDQHASSDQCLKGVLNAIPADIQQQAEAINAYIRQAQGHEIADKAAKTWDGIMASFFGQAAANDAQAEA